MTPPAPPRPRRSTSIGARLTLTLLPLVIIPLLVMGVAAYLRALQLVRQQANAELTGAVGAEFNVLRPWPHSGEELIAGRSQSPGIREPVAALLAAPAAFASRTQLSASLRSVQAPGGEVLFPAVMVVRAADQRGMASTGLNLGGAVVPAG